MRESLLPGFLNNTVLALALADSNLYAGGYFTMATNSGPVAVTVNRVADGAAPIGARWARGWTTL